MSALVLEPWSGYYTNTSSSISDFSLSDSSWEGGSHEEEAIWQLKSIMEPPEIPDPPRRSRRHLERRVRRSGEDGGAAKRPREVEKEQGVLEEEEETCVNNSSNTTFYIAVDKVLSSTAFVPAGESLIACLWLFNRVFVRRGNHMKEFNRVRDSIGHLSFVLNKVINQVIPGESHF